jgi:hypothetical protein
LVEGIRQASQLLDKHWGAVVALASRLYVDRHLEADAIAETLRPFGLTVSDRLRAPPKPAAKPKKLKQRIEHIYDDRDAPIVADLQRRDGWIGG